MFKFCDDAGHGGYDPGAIGTKKTTEKHINMAIASKIMFKAKEKGITGIYTRKNDVFVSLNQRCKIANQENCNIFVSIHCDSNPDRTVNGSTGYCYKLGGDGEKLARAIHSRVVAATGFKDHGVREGNFQVIRDTKMPAALIEVGFISNATQERTLNNEDLQWKVAKAVVDGIVDYIVNTERKC